MMLALRPYELRVTSADHAGKVGTKLRLRLQIGIAPLVNVSSREKPTWRWARERQESPTISHYQQRCSRDGDSVT